MYCIYIYTHYIHTLMTANPSHVTKIDVYTVCNHIWQDYNTVPTIGRVRAILGRGSHTTLHKHITTWKKDNSTDSTPTPSVISHGHELLTRIGEIMSNDTKRINELENEVSKLKTDVSNLESDLKHLEIKHEQLQRDFDELITKIKQ